MSPPPDLPVDPDQLADRLFGPTSPAFAAPLDRHRARREGSLCREAERTISLALQSADSELLQQLIVIAVEPAPDASRLLVLTSCPPELAPPVVEAALRHATPKLRSELARSLQRRKTPELSFAALPGGSACDDEPGGGAA